MNELVRYYLEEDKKKKIYGYTLKLCSYNIEQTEDLLQDVILRILEKNIQHDSSKGQVTTIFCRIIYSMFIDKIRKKKENYKKVEILESDRVTIDHPGFDLPFLLERVEKLPRKEKRVMREFIEGKSIAEISKEFDMNPITVRVNIFRARQVLKEEFKRLNLLNY